MMLTITKAILKKKAVEYLIVGLFVSLAWLFASFNGCRGCKSNDLTVIKTEYEKKDSVKQAKIDSLEFLHRNDAEIIDSLLQAKHGNIQEYSAFKETNKQKLNKKRNEIKNWSGDSLYHDVCRDLSRLYPDD